MFRVGGPFKPPILCANFLLGAINLLFGNINQIEELGGGGLNQRKVSIQIFNFQHLIPLVNFLFCPGSEAFKIPNNMVQYSNCGYTCIS